MGLIIHNGDPHDSFSVSGPFALSLSDRDSLLCLERDTLYEIVA